VLFLNAGPASGGLTNFQKDQYECCTSIGGVPGSERTAIATTFNAASAGASAASDNFTIPARTAPTVLNGIVLSPAGSASGKNTIRITSHGTFNTRYANMDENQERRMLCSGTIAVSDVGTTPGAVVASGTIEHLANHTHDRRKMYGVSCPGGWTNNDVYDGRHVPMTTHLNNVASTAMRDINRTHYVPIVGGGGDPEFPATELPFPQAQAGYAQIRGDSMPPASVWTQCTDQQFHTYPLRTSPCSCAIRYNGSDGCMSWRFSNNTPTGWAWVQQFNRENVNAGRTLETECTYGPATLDNGTALNSIIGNSSVEQPEYPQRTPSGSAISGSRDFADYPQRMMRSYPQKIDSAPFLINGGKPF
jgi:hypothetical protein